jgi:uncharacterized membrane protein YdjX (TVP38/TMEM64 family)
LQNLQSNIETSGIWAPLIYVIVYVLATALILPSTALNLAGGALFGVFWGIVWTSLAAVGSAVLTFWITRLWMKDWILNHLDQRFQVLDREISDGGLYYIFAVRLLPIIPYGVVNYSAGITSILFLDYLVGTILGTLIGLLPFVMLGNSGVEVIETRQAWRILFPMTLVGLLVIITTWYKGIRSKK